MLQEGKKKKKREGPREKQVCTRCCDFSGLPQVHEIQDVTHRVLEGVCRPTIPMLVGRLTEELHLCILDTHGKQVWLSVRLSTGTNKLVSPELPLLSSACWMRGHAVFGTV